MTSASGNPSDPSREMLEDSEGSPTLKGNPSYIDSLEKKIVDDRRDYIKKKVQENKLKLSEMSSNLLKLAMEREINNVSESEKSMDLLTKRKLEANDMLKKIDFTSSNSQEKGLAPSAIISKSFAVQSAMQPIKLPKVERLPLLTTRELLNRNQRMPENQSVESRRRIDYDPNEGEALTSDRKEEIIAEEEEKKLLTEYEEYILRMGIKEIGVTETAVDKEA